MEAFKTFLAIFLLSAVAVNAKFFSFEDCTDKNADRMADVSKFEIKPDPVEMRRGNMTVDAMVTLLRDPPEETVVKARYYKMKYVFGIGIEIPIPCLLGKFGSCTLPLCEYLKVFREQVEPFWPKDNAYGCPVKAGVYGGPDVVIDIPEMSEIARFIVQGKYLTELRVLESRFGKEVACFRVKNELKN